MTTYINRTTGRVKSETSGAPRSRGRLALTGGFAPLLVALLLTLFQAAPTAGAEEPVRPIDEVPVGSVLENLELAPDGLVGSLTVECLDENSATVRVKVTNYSDVARQVRARAKSSGVFGDDERLIRVAPGTTETAFMGPWANGKEVRAWMNDDHRVHNLLFTVDCLPPPQRGSLTSLDVRAPSIDSPRIASGDVAHQEGNQTSRSADTSGDVPTTSQPPDLAPTKPPAQTAENPPVEEAVVPLPTANMAAAAQTPDTPAEVAADPLVEMVDAVEADTHNSVPLYVSFVAVAAALGAVAGRVVRLLVTRG